ncbi:hypothetical protein [Lichenifustis flavocetrariae]|uniref:Uncharacterized protein n=1 Tax=Lichenifustis flavocetrariae TaxID=2949735 RepID=A0AA41YYF7_9HYPH|nr:hypothetical protein [Lichenifustis flavocetrariae]MCW6507193.1 hypothetical protein [Lichenifustis flavocetrariae]
MSKIPTSLDQQDARQGKTGVGVRNVLVWGLILVVVAFVVIYFVLKGTSG